MPLVILIVLHTMQVQDGPQELSDQRLTSDTDKALNACLTHPPHSDPQPGDGEHFQGQPERRAASQRTTRHRYLWHSRNFEQGVGNQHMDGYMVASTPFALCGEDMVDRKQRRNSAMGISPMALTIFT